MNLGKPYLVRVKQDGNLVVIKAREMSCLVRFLPGAGCSSLGTAGPARLLLVHLQTTGSHAPSASQKVFGSHVVVCTAIARARVAERSRSAVSIS